MAQLLKKSPMRLTRIAGRVVNRHVPCEDAIFSLHIPNTLKKEIVKHYLKDKFMCSEILPPLEEDEMTCWFEEPFIDITNDEWLTIQSWNYGIPYFAHEKNHMKYVFYTMDDGNDRYCMECAHTYLKNKATHKIQKWTDCNFETADNLIETMQCLDAWCARCTTRSLFWIEDWPWRSEHYLHIAEVVSTHYV